MATTDGSIVYTAFQNQIRDWFLAESGVPRVYWEEEDRGNESANKEFGILNVIADVALGVDDTRYSDHPTPTPGAELQVDTVGNRLVTVSCRVESRRQRPGELTARAYLSRAHTSLRVRSVRDVFLVPFNIAVVTIGAFQNLDFTKHRRRVSMGAMDVIFATTAHRVSTETYIEKYLVSSELKRADGSLIPSSLQLDDVEMP